MHRIAIYCLGRVAPGRGREGKREMLGIEGSRWKQSLDSCTWPRTLETFIACSSQHSTVESTQKKKIGEKSDYLVKD